MRNTSKEELEQLEPMQRFVAVNNLICDLLWDFTQSENLKIEMTLEEIHLCASVMDRIDPEMMEKLGNITSAERRSALNERLDKHNQTVLKGLAKMVLSRLPLAFEARGSNTGNNQSKENPDKVDPDQEPMRLNYQSHGLNWSDVWENLVPTIIVRWSGCETNSFLERPNKSSCVLFPFQCAQVIIWWIFTGIFFSKLKTLQNQLVFEQWR